MKQLPYIRQIQAKDYDVLKTIAKNDNHELLFPTHVIERDGEIVGYASANATPILNTWVHSKLVTARESMMLLNIAENALRMAGGKSIVLPCSENSPFYPHIEKLGYQRLGHTTFNLKKL